MSSDRDGPTDAEIVAACERAAAAHPQGICDHLRVAEELNVTHDPPLSNDLCATKKPAGPVRSERSPDEPVVHWVANQMFTHPQEGVACELCVLKMRLDGLAARLGDVDQRTYGLQNIGGALRGK